MINIWGEIIRLYTAGRDAILITVIDKKGMDPSAVGKKMLVDDSGLTKGSVGGGELEFLALEKARELMGARRHGIENYNLSGEQAGDAAANLDMICGGSVTIFFEFLPAPPILYIIGMGHIGRSLANIMGDLGWRIVTAEYREQSAPDGTPDPTRVFADMIEKETPPPGSFAVIAGYSHQEDYEVLKAIYRSKWKPRYIGLVASVHKSRLMVNRLAEELGDSIDLGVLHSPVGLDIGGNTPEEIALSIMAELQSIRYGKEGHRHLGIKWAQDSHT